MSCCVGTEGGSDSFGGGRTPQQSPAGTGAVRWLDFAIMVVYLFILCLLVVPGLILDRGCGRQGGDKGFSA